MDQSFVAVISVIVSGVVGIAGVTLALLKRSESESISRAVRRTSALQMLSDEERILSNVRDEISSLDTVVEANRDALGARYDPFRGEVQRIAAESIDLLSDVRARRDQAKLNLAKLSSEEIEELIADAYHGKTLAEAQLVRTTRSIESVLSTYLSQSTS